MKFESGVNKVSSALHTIKSDLDYLVQKGDAVDRKIHTSSLWYRS
jgi:hypothetical protein